MPWFTVVSWKYDGSDKNGMPTDSVNNKMIEFEKVLESAFENTKVSKHAYNRTGNNLKEFNYYISNREKFMTQFNKAFVEQERYPIEINFYKDSEWTEMNNLINNFEKKQ